MGKDFFTSQEACKSLHITPRALKSACDGGLLDFGEPESKVPGRRRKLSRRQLIFLMVSRLLAKHGFTVEQISAVIAAIKQNRFLCKKLDPDAAWRTKLRQTPIGPERKDKPTRSRVRLIVMDIEKTSKPLKVRITAKHRPNLRLPFHGGVRIVPIESAYREVERL